MTYRRRAHILNDRVRREVMRIHGRYDRKGRLKKGSRTRRLLSPCPMCARVLPSTWRIDNWLKWVGPCLSHICCDQRSCEVCVGPGSANCSHSPSCSYGHSYGRSAPATVLRAYGDCWFAFTGSCALSPLTGEYEVDRRIALRSC
jgi:hypothetical protein